MSETTQPEIDNLRGQLAALQGELEESAAAIEEMRKERDQARAACAEMRAMFEHLSEYWNFGGDRAAVDAAEEAQQCSVQMLTKTDCGRGWLPPDVAKELVAALEYVKRWWDETGRDEGWHKSIGLKVEHAIARAKELL